MLVRHGQLEVQPRHRRIAAAQVLAAKGKAPARAPDAAGATEGGVHVIARIGGPEAGLCKDVVLIIPPIGSQGIACPRFQATKSVGVS